MRLLSLCNIKNLVQYRVLIWFLPCFVMTSCVNHKIDNSLSNDVVAWNGYRVMRCDKSAQRNIVLVGGCFDLLHYGHLEFLKKSKESGGYLVVALEPDSKIVKYKKRQPIHSQEQRAKNLCSVRFVDEVILLPYLDGFDDYNNLVQKIKPTIILATEGDSQLENKTIQAKSVGAIVRTINQVGQFSNSNIITKLSE